MNKSPLERCGRDIFISRVYAIHIKWRLTENKPPLKSFSSSYVFFIYISIQSKAAIIFFDVTAKATYKHLPNWYRDILRVCDYIPVVIGKNLKFVFLYSLLCCDIYDAHPHTHITQRAHAHKHNRYKGILCACTITF